MHLRNRKKRAIGAAVSLGAALYLAGCGTASSTGNSARSAVQPRALQGAVHGGIQPVVGAHVYVFAAGNSGIGGPSISLLNASVTGYSDAVGAYVPTDSNGSFVITNDYNCTPNSQVYLYALGGNPGAGTNSQMGMLAVLGNCPASGTFAQTIPFVFMNEVSTVAAAYAMASFASDATHVSTSTSAAAEIGIANAFANASNLASISTGVALTSIPNGTGTVPQAEIDALANILTACVNSSDAAPAPCTTLFADSMNGAAVPTDTATAAINIAHNPGSNVAALYALSPSSPPFQPTLTKLPNDFMVGINLTGGGLVSPRGIQIDASGDAWIVNQGNGSSNLGSITEFSPLGVALSGSTGYIGGGISTPYGIALDSVGDAWVVNFGNNSVSEFSNQGLPITSTGYTGGGLNQPYNIAIDGSGNLWIANINSNYLSEFNSQGIPVSPTGYSGGGLGSQRAVAIDSSERVWVVNSGNSSLALFSSGGAPVSPSGGYTGGGLGGTSNPRSLAIDHSGNVWAAGETSNALSVISSSGTAVSPAGGYAGGGLSNPYGVAIDGAGQVWVSNDSSSNSISEFSNTGVALSPSTGFTGAGLAGLALPHSIAVDGSGDIWVVNTTSVTEFIGAASPTVTPLPVAVANNQLGVRVDQPASPVTPSITWPAPQSIPYGTALSSAQLNATASVAGTFVYSPALGATLTTGPQTLSVTFTPNDTTDYTSAQASVGLVVTKALPVITWPAPAGIAAGSSLTSAQLDASANVNGTFVYTPAAGTTETVPGNLTLSTVFTPSDTTDYLPVSATTKLTLTTAGPPTYPAYSWTNVTIEGGGYVDGLYFHPLQQNLIYAKTDIGGAYRWNPATTSWVALEDWINRTQGTYFATDYWGTDALALDPTDPNQLYLGVGISSSNGNLLISHDQGNTFNTVPLPFPIGSNNNGRSAGERMAVDPNLPSRIYFGTENKGLWYSDNRGLSWTQNTNFPTLATTNQQGIVFVLPVASSGTSGNLSPLIFAGAADATTGGTLNTLYVSTNAGATWTAFNGKISGSLLPWRGRLGPHNELYVTYNNGLGPSGITQGMICSYAFTNAGVISPPTNITPTLANGVTAGFSDVEPDLEASGTLIAATIDSSSGQDAIYRTTTDGASWVSMSNDTHSYTAAPYVSYHQAVNPNPNGNWINLAIDPFNSGHAIYGTGQMIWETTNLTATNSGGSVAWTEKAAGQEELVIEALSAPPSGSTLLLSGVEDLAGFPHSNLSVSPSAGNYTPVNTGVVTSIDFSEANPNFVARVGGGNNNATSKAPYGAYTTNALANSWTAFSNSPLPNSAVGSGSIAVSSDGTTLVWSPYDVATVYSTNNGASWSLSSGAPQGKLVASDRVNANKFYIASGSTLYESLTKGSTFVAAATGLPSGNAYASFAGEEDVWLASSTGGLYHNTSTTLGTLAMTQDTRFKYAYLIAFGAPQSGSGYNDTVYVAGNMNGVDGLFRSTNNGSTWQQIDDQQHQYGTLNVLAADRRTFGTIYIGTAGRGIIWGTSSY